MIEEPIAECRRLAGLSPLVVAVVHGFGLAAGILGAAVFVRLFVELVVHSPSLDPLQIAGGYLALLGLLGIVFGGTPRAVVLALAAVAVGALLLAVFPLAA